MRIFDTKLMLGNNWRGNGFQCSDIDSVTDVLDKYRIEKAFLSPLLSAVFFDLERENQRVFDACRQNNRLIPCPLVIPNYTLGTGGEERFVDKLIKNGSRCFNFYPKTSNILIQKRVIGELFSVIEKRKVPLLIPYEELDLVHMIELLELFPKIAFIYSNISWREDAQRRNLFPVLKEFSNLFIDTIPAPNKGIEEIVDRFGSHRMVFSSSFPLKEPGAALSYLFYSEINTDDMENIAFRNLEKLIAGVVI